MAFPGVIIESATAVRPFAIGVGLRLYGATSGFAGIKSPAIGGSTEYTLPASPTDGRFLKADGSGVLSWDVLNCKANNAADQLLILEGIASQTGIMQQFRGRSSTTDGRLMANIDTAWATSTDASRKARLILSVYDTAVREAIRCEATGSTANSAIGGNVFSGTKLHVAGRGLFTAGATESLDSSPAGVAIAYDTANDRGMIQAIASGVGFKPLVLQPNGNTVGLGATPAAGAKFHCASDNVVYSTGQLQVSGVSTPYAAGTLLDADGQG